MIFQRYYKYNILFCDLGPPLPILTLHCTSRNQYQSVADNIETDAHTYPYAKRPCLRYHQYHLSIIAIIINGSSIYICVLYVHSSYWYTIPNRCHLRNKICSALDKLGWANLYFLPLWLWSTKKGDFRIILKVFPKVHLLPNLWIVLLFKGHFCQTS